MSEATPSGIQGDALLVSRAFLQFLARRNILSKEVRELLSRSGPAAGVSLREILAQPGVKESPLYQALSDFSKLPLAARPGRIAIPLLKLIPVNVAQRYGFIPLEQQGHELIVGVVTPLNETVLQLIRSNTRMEVVRQTLLPLTELEELIHSSYADLGRPPAPAPHTEPARPRRETSSEKPRVAEGEDPLAVLRAIRIQAERGTLSPDSGGVVDILDELLVAAHKAQASDIHLEPRERAVVVRFRLDGQLKEMVRLPLPFREPLLSRLKVLCQLDVTEKYRPQDGRFEFFSRKRSVETRASFFRTVNGEKAALRLLDSEGSRPDIATLGLEREQRDLLQEMIHRPYGAVLVSGPTGSGKSTTLYAALEELNQEHVNITTVEDPAEYRLDGANQCSVQRQRGLDFHLALRALLRQDPDVIMLGEIRDYETAEIAFQAALTGHMVFATIHTNDSLSTINRLINLDIDPTVVALGLVGILSQRLVRKVCPYCREVYRPDPLIKQRFGISDLPDVTFARGRGCSECRGVGLRGRTGVFELLEITPRLQEAIQVRRPMSDIREMARRDGLQTLRFSCLRKLLRHETTVEEVLGATVSTRSLQS
jgi:type II secretory ATPase GspE/PulE/Tfp pilus assembly ATPase PilB-like protein